jgi:hypothetical protein
VANKVIDPGSTLEERTMKYFVDLFLNDAELRDEIGNEHGDLEAAKLDAIRRYSSSLSEQCHQLGPQPNVRIALRTDDGKTVAHAVAQISWTEVKT